MVKCKFEEELDGALACNSLAHGISEKVLCKKQKLQIPPKIEARPIFNMKQSWRDNLEINVRVMLDPGANVLVLAQSLVGEKKVSVVLQKSAEIITRYDSTVDTGVGSAYTFACTVYLADHYIKESFEVSPLQDNYDILMPWCWTLQYPIRYLHSGA